MYQTKLFLFESIEELDISYKQFWVLHYCDGKSGWVGWADRAYSHPDFGRIEGAAGQRCRVILLLAHSDFQTLRRPCAMFKCCY